MPNSRQLDAEVLVRSFGVTFSRNVLSPPTSETWDQLVFAIRGVLTVKAEAGTWVVPPHRAVWLPANAIYSLEVSGQTALRMLYLPRIRRKRGSVSFDRGQCKVISVSPLLRELIVRTVQIGALEAGSAQHRRIAGLIEDELQTVETVPLQLPYPRHVMARQFVALIENHLGGPPNISQALTACGSSRRTMERLFRAETEMSLGQWIRRRKLLWGLQLLVSGETAGAVAFKLGYNSPSAFIAMFKREIGETPGAVIRP